MTAGWPVESSPFRWNRAVILCAVAVLTLLCRRELIGSAQSIPPHGMHIHHDSLLSFGSLVAAWIVMMVGMMAPSLLPFC